MYWFKVPDDETMLMNLKPAELRCYLVVQRALQRDEHKGKISVRQVAERAGIALKSAHEALTSLVEEGHLHRETRDGAATLYDLPFSWANGANCAPTGEHLKAKPNRNRTPTGKRSEAKCTPTGEQLCSPTGEPQRLLENTENRERTCSPDGERSHDGEDQHHEVDRDDVGRQDEAFFLEPPEPVRIGEQRTKKQTGWSAEESSHAFQEFWRVWPRRVAKAAAERAFSRCATSPEVADQIMAAVQAQLPQLTADLKYCPYPTTWLNQKRYEDETGESQGSAGRLMA